MITSLTPEERMAVENALVKSFDKGRLRHMLNVKLGFKLEDEIDTARGLKFVMSDVLDRALEGWLEKLLLAAVEYSPASAWLKDIVAQLNITPVQKLQQDNLPLHDAQAQARLEKIVRKRSAFQAFTKFTESLTNLGRQICRIEYPAGSAQGTGWLVAPDLVLTAYHVIEKIDHGTNGFLPGDVTLRFDLTDSTELAALRTCRLAPAWVLDKSPYAPKDVGTDQIDPTALQLDYALLKLNERAGDDIMTGGDIRGWIQVTELAPVMSTDDFVFVVQHPQGRALELALGEILRYNNAANRVTYDTNTEPGSSGAPCFDVNLVPFALHHAAGPDDNLEFNQAVPLREIIKSMKKNQVTPFWSTTSQIMSSI